MEQTKEPILCLENVSKGFSTPNGYIKILEKINLTVFPGEKVAIIGPSGSGKSTLLSLIGLLDQPSEGTIKIAGVETSALNEKELSSFRNKKIGFVFQSFELISPFTVAENIAAPADIANKTIDETTIFNLVKEMKLEDKMEALPYTLSGGEKQRVAIGRALINDPEIILADEPTGSLDRDTGEVVLKLLLEKTSEQQRTLIVITHDYKIAEQMDRVLEIKDRTLHERP